MIKMSDINLQQKIIFEESIQELTEISLVDENYWKKIKGDLENSRRSN